MGKNNLFPGIPSTSIVNCWLFSRFSLKPSHGPQSGIVSICWEKWAYRIFGGRPGPGGVGGEPQRWTIL